MNSNYGPGNLPANAAFGSTKRREPAVSVIVPARNEACNISRCLQSLVDQELTPDKFEVILVDNQSTDSTVEIAMSYGSLLDLTVVSNAKGYISALRNLGAARARAQVLAFLDADCAAPPNWLLDAVQLASRAEVGVLGAHYRIPGDSSWVARIWDRYHGSSKSGEASYVPAGDLIMPRTAFRLVSGFDETIQTNEDAELCARVRDVGLQVCAYPELGVVHFGTPQSLTAFYRKERWHGMHVLRVFLRDISKSPNTRVILFGAYILFCQLGAALGLLFWLATGRWNFFWILLSLLASLPLGLGIQKILPTGRWLDLPGLTVVYTVYGLARSHCILLSRDWLIRENVPAAVSRRCPLDSCRLRGGSRPDSW